MGPFRKRRCHSGLRGCGGAQHLLDKKEHMSQEERAVLDPRVEYCSEGLYGVDCPVSLESKKGRKRDSLVPTSLRISI